MLLNLSLLSPHLLEFEQVFTLILRYVGVINYIDPFLGRLLSFYVFLCDKADLPRQPRVQILFEYGVIAVAGLHLV